MDLFKLVDPQDAGLAWIRGNRGDPGTAILIAALGAGAMSAIGKISEGQSAAAASDYNAQISRNNALTATRVAAAHEEAQRRASNAALGQQTAAIAQAGIGFGGSAADIARQSRINAAMNELTIRYEGENRAAGYRADADLLSYQAGQDRTAGYIGAGSAILGGVANYGMSAPGQAQLQKWMKP